MKIIKKILDKLSKFISKISDTSITDDKSNDPIPKRSGHIWLNGGDPMNNLSSRRFKK